MKRQPHGQHCHCRICMARYAAYMEHLREIERLQQEDERALQAIPATDPERRAFLDSLAPMVEIKS